MSFHEKKKKKFTLESLYIKKKKWKQYREFQYISYLFSPIIN